MRKIGLLITFVYLTFGVVPSWSSIIDFTFSYDVTLNSWYKYGETELVETVESHNQLASTRRTDSPYNGGSELLYREDLSYYQLAAIFNGRSEALNWTSNEIAGILSVGTSSEYPEGSLVPFQVYYELGHNEAMLPLSAISAGLEFWKDNYSQEVYSISGKAVVTDLVYFTAGQEYEFYAWYSAGSRTEPITENFLGGILFNFEPIPEPASVFLLLVGSLVLMKQVRNH